MRLGAGSLYRIKDKTLLFSVPFFVFRPEAWLSGVPALAPSTPFASRFFKDSFFSRCSRGAGGLRAREVAKSGFNGDETAGICCSSSSPSGRFCGIVDGVELRRLGTFSAMLMLMNLAPQFNPMRPHGSVACSVHPVIRVQCVGLKHETAICSLNIFRAPHHIENSPLNICNPRISTYLVGYVVRQDNEDVESCCVPI